MDIFAPNCGLCQDVSAQKNILWNPNCNWSKAHKWQFKSYCFYWGFNSYLHASTLTTTLVWDFFKLQKKNTIFKYGNLKQMDNKILVSENSST